MDQLTQHVQQLEEQISLNEAQCQAQAQETKAMKETLAEAAMELEVQLLWYMSCIYCHGLARAQRKDNGNVKSMITSKA